MFVGEFADGLQFDENLFVGDKNRESISAREFSLDIPETMPVAGWLGYVRQLPPRIQYRDIPGTQARKNQFPAFVVFARIRNGLGMKQ